MARLIFRATGRVFTGVVAESNKADYITFTKQGNMITGTNQLIWEAVYPCIFNKATFSLITAPTTGTVTFSLAYYTYSSNTTGSITGNAVIAEGTKRIEKTGINTNLYPGDRIMVSTTSIGSPTSGADLTVTLEIVRT